MRMFNIYRVRTSQVFGFLLLVFFILCVTCAEITMVLVYFSFVPRITTGGGAAL